MMIDNTITGKRRNSTACVGSEEAAAIFGWPAYYLPILVSTGHLKPLGKPAQNSRKWFATVELERLSRDADWLDKAVRIVERSVREMNQKQRTTSPRHARDLTAPADASIRPACIPAG